MCSAFSENLKTICATRHSISEICRDLTINRQQFNRYINGQSRPSPHNLLKIAQYFQISPEDLELPIERFKEKISGTTSNSLNHSEAIFDFFKHDLSQTEQYLGDYQTFHVSPSWPGFIICSFTRIWQSKNMLQVKSIERIDDPLNEVRQKSKYVGLLSISRNKIFIVEKSLKNPAMIAETILQPFEMHQSKYLKGLTVGVSWRHDNMPYAARTIWKKLSKNTNLKNTLKKCGQYKSDSHELPTAVRHHFSPQSTRNDILI